MMVEVPESVINNLKTIIDSLNKTNSKKDQRIRDLERDLKDLTKVMKLDYEETKDLKIQIETINDSLHSNGLDRFLEILIENIGLRKQIYLYESKRVFLDKFQKSQIKNMISIVADDESINCEICKFRELCFVLANNIGTDKICNMFLKVLNMFESMPMNRIHDRSGIALVLKKDSWANLFRVLFGHKNPEEMHDGSSIGNFWALIQNLEVQFNWETEED